MKNSPDRFDPKLQRRRRFRDAQKHKYKNRIRSDRDDLILDTPDLTEETTEKEEEFVIEGYRDEYSQDLIRILEMHDLKPNTKRLGQHFLTNQEVLKIMVQAAEIEKGDSILEIGPGPGNLTQEIWKICSEVRADLTAIELDERFRPILNKIAEGSEIKLIWGEAIQEFGKIAEQYQINKLVANIPYQILEPLLVAIHINKGIKRVVLMVGDSYAERACVGIESSRRHEPFSKTSLFGQARFIPEIIATVHREDFIPPPMTESAVLVLKERDKKNRNSIFEKIANYMTEWPNVSVKQFLQERIHSTLGRKKARGERGREAMMCIPTAKSLGLSETILNTPLSRLTNAELQLFLSRLDLLRKKQRDR